MNAVFRANLVIGLLILAVSLAVTAHKPVSIGGIFPTYEQALSVTEIDVSQVAYSPLDQENRALWLVFDAPEGTHLDVSLGVPVLDRLADYRPALAVFGPGLPPIELPIQQPPGVGGVILTPDSPATAKFFHEPVTGTDSWILIDDMIELPESGTYYLVAFADGEQSDKLWVAIGKREQFGFRDFLAFPSIIRDARSFHEVDGRPNGVSIAGRVSLFAFAVAVGVLLFAGRN